MPKTKIVYRTAARNEFRSQRKFARANKLPHVWKTDAKIGGGPYPYKILLNRSPHLPRAKSYVHAREIAVERGFRAS